uniref:Uncharacterized protein n=1 Tax=Panagrolaimus davidi TaxID=227884 RepID=A0A914QU53_9BILA
MMIKEPDSILIFMRNRICVYEKSDVLKLYRMKNVYFRITSFEIDSKISSEDFLRHLTLTTRRLICMYSEITPKIELAEILGKVRNIEQLVLTRYNTVIQKDWPQNLLKYIDGQNLKRFSFQIDSLDFNVGDLVSVMTVSPFFAPYHLD